jgi:hypothetical protein
MIGGGWLVLLAEKEKGDSRNHYRASGKKV